MHKECMAECMEGFAWVCLWPVAALRSGAWSSALCLRQAAVISGAQRTEFIWLSQGHEPFWPATPQFVSHFTPYNSLNAACLCTSDACTSAAYITDPSDSGVYLNSWIHEWRDVSKSHDSMHDKAFYEREIYSINVNTIWLMTTSLILWFCIKCIYDSNLVQEKKTSYTLKQKCWNKSISQLMIFISESANYFLN